MSEHVITLQINGKEVRLDVEADTEIGPDLDYEMRTIPGKIAWYGRILASAEVGLATAEADHRHIVAMNAEAYAAKHAASKPAEWRIKQYVEAGDDFLKSKKRVATTESLVVELKHAIYGLQAKVSMLNSLGARERVEYGSSGGVRTPAEEQPTSNKKKGTRNA